jgi:hypothetical protein
VDTGKEAEPRGQRVQAEPGYEGMQQTTRNQNKTARTSSAQSFHHWAVLVSHPAQPEYHQV